MTAWPTKKLGEICEINMGQSPASSTYNERQAGLPFYQGKKDYGEKYLTPRVWCSNPIKTVEAGDILISVRAPVGALNVAKEKSCIGRGLAGLRASRELDQDFLFLFLKMKEKDIASLGIGSTFTAISKRDIENIKIPLPPLGEQRKIVGKIEDIFAKIDEASRLRAESSTASLLPSALHQIFTTQQHPYKLEYVGMSQTKQKAWEEKFFGEIVEIDTTRNTKKELPFVGMEDIEARSGDFIGSRESREVRSTTFHFDTRHVLYGKLRPYLNKVFLPDFEGHCTTEFLPLLPKREFLTREWLAVWLRCGDTVNDIMATTTGTRMPRANMNKVKKFKIPLPPVAEQKKIVEYLDSLSAKARALQSLQQETKNDFSALRQSLLSQAFSG